MDGPKFFNKWDVTDVKINDQGLLRYISVQPRILPKTGNRFVQTRFHKSQLSIVERLINKVMVPGHKSKKHWQSSGNKTGKGWTASQIVFDAFTIIEKKTNKNPVAVLVDAVVNAAPREEVLTIEYGGARYPKAVECAPQRRIDIALRYFTQGASQKAFGSKKEISSALADEIIAASTASNNSLAISKKMEVERQADSAR